MSLRVNIDGWIGTAIGGEIVNGVSDGVGRVGIVGRVQRGFGSEGTVRVNAENGDSHAGLVVGANVHVVVE